MRQNAVEAVIDRVHVNGNRDAALSRNTGGFGHRGSIVPVDMNHPCVRDDRRCNFLFIQPQAIRPPPEHGSFPRGFIDQNVSGLVRTILSHLHVIEVDAGSEQALHLDAPAFIVPHRTDIFNA